MDTRIRRSSEDVAREALDAIRLAVEAAADDQGGGHGDPHDSR